MEIIKFNKNIPIKFTRLLREISAGIYGGSKSNNKKFIDFKNKRKNDNFYRPKNGESISDTYNRLKKFKNKIIKNNKNQTILIITHGMSFIILYSLFKNLELKNIDWNIKIESYKLKKITIKLN